MIIRFLVQATGTVYLHDEAGRAADRSGVQK